MKPLDKTSLPDGMHPLTPHLICDGAAGAIDFYKAAFGAEELMRLPGEDGGLMHACVVINGSSVFLADEYHEHGGNSPKRLKGTPVTIHLMVEDVDAAFKQAVDAGANTVMPVENMFWGDRYGILEDPFGHQWSISTPVEQKTPEEIRAAMKAM